MDKLLLWWGKLNKYKHGQHCHYQQKHFNLFALSVDVMMGKEFQLVLAT